MNHNLESASRGPASPHGCQVGDNGHCQHCWQNCAHDRQGGRMRGRRRGFTQSREVHLNTLAILLLAFPRETRDREPYDNQFELILSPRTNQGRFLVQRSGTGLGHRQEVWLLPGTSGGCRGAGRLPASPHVDAQGVGRQDCKGWEACSCREARCSTNPLFLKSAMQAPMQAPIHASCSFASSRSLT